MPNYRDVYLEQGKILADSGSHTIDISPVDPISQLIVNIWADNGATSNKNAPIPRVITKIEVIDGADVLFSMDGRLAYALAFYLTGRMPSMSIDEEGGQGQSVNIPLCFGRWLWDPIYALDPGRFRNLQLRVSWNLAAVQAVGVTGFATGTAQLSVVARVMSGLESPPVGFIMSKDHYSWTTGASGDERVALPTDYPYLIAMIRAWEAGVEFTDSVTNLKLNIDFDKFIPFDVETGDLVNFNQEYFGIVEYNQIHEGDDSELHELWLADAETIQAIMVENDIFCSVATFANGRYSLYQTLHDGTAQNAKTANLHLTGVGPFNCIAHPFGVLQDPTTYLQAQEHGDVKLVVTQGNAGAEANVILAQLRIY